MKQTTGYPVIDEILDSLRPQAPRTTTNDRELENHEWDTLAERLRVQVRGFVDEQIDAELTRIENEKERQWIVTQH